MKRDEKNHPIYERRNLVYKKNGQFSLITSAMLLLEKKSLWSFKSNFPCRLYKQVTTAGIHKRSGNVKLNVDCLGNMWRSGDEAELT